MEGTSGKDDRVVVQHKFNFWDFDRSGTVPIWTMAQHIQSLAYQAKIKTFFKSPLHGYPSTEVHVLRSQSWEIFPSYYKCFRPDSILTATIKMLNVGKTSFTVETEVSDTSSAEVVVKNLSQYVNFGMDTRKTKPLPDWVRKRYAHLTSQPRPTTVQVFERPAFTTPFVHSVSVQPSHIDWNNHVFQHYYITYCFDCAALGARSGMYATVKGNILKHKVRNFSVLYQREALEGDVLSVESWEDERHPGTLKFQVKKGSVDIVQMAIAFYTSSDFKKQESKL
ncbi:uncharacterized protein LOC144905944 [Branchiostoma floridae x Branchiostoma belcheri]